MMITQYNVFVKEQYNAIKKAEDDVNTVWSNMGIKNSVKHRTNRALSCIERLIRLSCSDVILVQYPAYSEKILRIVGRGKTKPVYALVHDLKCLREKTVSIEEELDVLNKFNGLIVLTEPMRDLLEKYGYKGKMSCLQMWDYLQDSGVDVQSTENSMCVCFAGNLSKSPFIRQLVGFQTEFLVYGDTNAIEADNMVFKGVYSPEALPSVLEGNWGLVWDGESLNGCTGHYGDYLHYNIPHKTGLYLAAGKPIIAWSGAAISEYVRNNQLGISIDCLSQLDEVLKSVDVNTYLKYKENVMRVRNDIISGVNIRNATEQILERK